MLLFNTIGLALLALLAIPAIIVICLKSPKIIALPMLAVLMLFSSSTWGQLQIENTIYSRGVGVLNFSLFNLLLFTAGLATLLRRLATPSYPQLAPPISPYFVGFAGLLLAHIVVGIISGINFFDIVGYSGIINVLNMLIFMFLVISAFRTAKDQKKLLFLIISLAGLRAAFGIIRYVWFGGDSANPYKNFEGLEMKLIFFDINDNFIASLAAFWAAWLLTSGKKIAAIKRLSLYLFLALEIATVALSFRRSSLIGIALMFALLLYQLPNKRRTQFLLLATGILLTTALVFFQQRLQYSSHGDGNFISALIYDISPEKNIETENRFYELLAAARSIGHNWLTGLGTWGTFTGDQDILSYHFGKFDFVHSGFGHLILKTGLIGLFLFSTMLWKFATYYFRHRKFLAGNPRLIADMGFAGLLFWLPTLLIGTPIIEFRTMLLIGFTMALPFLAVSLKYPQSRQDAQQQTLQHSHQQSLDYATT